MNFENGLQIPYFRDQDLPHDPPSRINNLELHVESLLWYKRVLAFIETQDMPCEQNLTRECRDNADREPSLKAFSRLSAM